MPQDTIVVGAGIAGLRCAGALQLAGRPVRVLERARTLGGRCATRRFEGQPVDFGPVFLQGLPGEFLAALHQVPGPQTLWPLRVDGAGPPCQPGALDAGTIRLAFPAGLRAFPDHLAQGLDIRLETRVTALRLGASGFQVETADGVEECRDLVLALALEQSRRLLATLPSSAEVDGIHALLGMFASEPCLALIAGYPLEVPAPAWDLLLPENAPALQLVAHDSGKRAAPRFRTLVVQAQPRWSRRRLEAEPGLWAAELLAELGTLLGPWARQPLWTHPHRWRYARVDAANTLTRPIQITFPGGQRLGLAGDAFAPEGGAQAAWWSGFRLAERLLDAGTQKEP